MDFFTSTKNFSEILIETLKKTSKVSNYGSNHAQFTFFNGSNLTQMLPFASSEQNWNYEKTRHSVHGKLMKMLVEVVFYGEFIDSI